MRVGLEARLDMHHGADRLVDRREGARAERAEDRRAQHRAFPLARDARGLADDVGHDLHEAVGLGAAAGQPEIGDAAVDVALEGIDHHAHLIGAALEQRADQILAVVIEPERRGSRRARRRRNRA